MFLGQQLYLIWALIICGFTSAAGKGHQYEALFLMLAIVFGGFNTNQIIVISFLHIIIVMVNELWRSSR